MSIYVPRKGDFIALTFDPQAGHEQKGRRPALVISQTAFNERTGLALVCPVTNTDRGNPFHVRLPQPCILTGVVMVDQVKSVDYRARKTKLIEKAPATVLNEALALLDAIVF
ncbi:MAG: type II toxin-antitoxin system PemK/MazF family toxin [Fibrobacterota bacterium]